MFGRVASAYGIDVEALAAQLPAAEVERLREIEAVRGAVLSLQQRAVTENRRWLSGGVAGLVLAGACSGLALTAEATVTEHHLYRSLGVLTETEQLDAFDRIHEHIPEGDHPTALRRREMVESLLARLDTAEIVTDEPRGTGFVEPLPEGRRYFQHVTSMAATTPSPLRWFVIPALMFLGGAIGCFAAAFRWR